MNEPRMLNRAPEPAPRLFGNHPTQGRGTPLASLGTIPRKAVGRPSRQELVIMDYHSVQTTCPYCGVGCQIDLHVKDNEVIRVTGTEDATPNLASTCIKGRFGYDFINHSERLTSPLIKENGKFKEAGWDEALSLVADRLRDIKSKHGPDSIGVFCSAKITNGENYLAQKFARAAIGTNNVDHCARL